MSNIESLILKLYDNITDVINIDYNMLSIYNVDNELYVDIDNHESILTRIDIKLLFDTDTDDYNTILSRIISVYKHQIDYNNTIILR